MTTPNATALRRLAVEIIRSVMREREFDSRGLNVYIHGSMRGLLQDALEAADATLPALVFSLHLITGCTDDPEVPWMHHFNSLERACDLCRPQRTASSR
jgi:hypothetical protein